VISAPPTVYPGITEDVCTPASRSIWRSPAYTKPLRYLDMNLHEDRLAIDQDPDDRLDPDVRLKRSGDGLGSR
jgi:hypothetical protein